MKAGLQQNKNCPLELMFTPPVMRNVDANRNKGFTLSNSSNCMLHRVNMGPKQGPELRNLVLKSKKND